MAVERLVDGRPRGRVDVEMGNGGRGVTQVPVSFARVDRVDGDVAPRASASDGSAHSARSSVAPARCGWRPCESEYTVVPSSVLCMAWCCCALC